MNEIILYTEYRCNKCKIHRFKPKRHFSNGKLCDGEWEEGTLIWRPKEIK